MLWALDEVTQTCPLPLPSMLADAGGRGIQIMPVVHGAAQLRTRWGRDGARAILDTTSVKVFLPGISDPRDAGNGLQTGRDDGRRANAATNTTPGTR